MLIPAASTLRTRTEGSRGGGTRDEPLCSLHYSDVEMSIHPDIFNHPDLDDRISRVTIERPSSESQVSRDLHTLRR